MGSPQLRRSRLAPLTAPRSGGRRAASSNATRSSGANWRELASRATVSRWGQRLTPRSISLTLRALIPARAANSACVNPAARRPRRSSAPKLLDRSACMDHPFTITPTGNAPLRAIRHSGDSALSLHPIIASAPSAFKESLRRFCDHFCQPLCEFHMEIAPTFRHARHRERVSGVSSTQIRRLVRSRSKSSLLL